MIADGLERIGGVDGPARPPWAGRLTQPGQHHPDVQGLTRQRVVDRGDLGLGGSPVDGDGRDGAGLRGGQYDLLDAEQGHVDGTSGDVAAQRFQQTR